FSASRIVGGLFSAFVSTTGGFKKPHHYRHETMDPRRLVVHVQLLPIQLRTNNMFSSTTQRKGLFSIYKFLFQEHLMCYVDPVFIHDSCEILDECFFLFYHLEQDSKGNDVN
ncbi:histone H3.3, partial [Striga asiatica]